MKGKIREFFSGFSKNFWILVISWILFRAGHSMTIPYFSNYVISLGGSEASVGLVSAVEGYVFALIAIPGGYIADVYGRKKIVVGFTWILVLSTLLYVIAPAWWFLIIALIISALTRIYIPALRAIFADSVEPGFRGRASIISELVPNIIAIPFPFIAGYILSLHGDYNPVGYKILYLMSFLTGVVAALLRQKLLTETLKGVKARFFDALIEGFKRGYRDIIGSFYRISKHMKLILIANILTYFSMGLALPYFIRYAFLNGYESGMWGFLLMVFNATFIVTQAVLYPFVDKISHKVLLALTICSESLGLLIFSFGGIIGIAIGYFLWYVIGGLRWVAMTRITFDVTPRIMRGRVSALLIVAGLISSSTGNLTAAAIYSFRPSLTFLLASLLSALSVIIIALIPKIEKLEK